MRKVILIVIVLAIILGVVFYFVMANMNKKPAVQSDSASLIIYGLWENENFMKPAIDEYVKTHPKVSITYKYQSSINYRSRVQAQLDANQGPDIFMIHNTWLPIFLRNNYLAPLPETVMSDADYTKSFYPVVKDSFSKNGNNYALPLEVDGLAMYVNESLFAEAGVLVPANWQEFTDTAVKLTKKDEKGKILQAGAALGTASNVDHWSDILGLLYLQQQGADLTRPDNDKGAEVLRFYTNFVLSPDKKVWDLSMESSTQAFSSGRLAMYFGPSWRMLEIRAANPQLKFRVVPVPQLSLRTAAWATFWGFSVSSTSPAKSQAWDFLNFLTSAEIQKLLYKNVAEARSLGQPYSRVELQSELAPDPIVGAFVTQGPIYKSWYLSSNTFDQDINDKMIKYFEDAVNATLQGSDPQAALGTTAKGVQQVLGDLDKATNAAPVATPL